MPHNQVQCRFAQDRDLSRITEIYNHFIVNTPVTFDLVPKEMAERRSWMESFDAAGPHQLWVAELSGEVAGAAWSHSFRPKAAYKTSVETSIYMDPHCAGQGIGTALYRALFRALNRQGLHRAYAGITLPNPASVALHRHLGFDSVGTYREVGYKMGRFWDVEWFEKALDETDPAT